MSDNTTDFDWLEIQKQAHTEFSARVAAITNWDAPTPDTEWTVRDLVCHVVTEQQWVAPLLSGLSLADAKQIGRASCRERVF